MTTAFFNALSVTASAGPPLTVAGAGADEAGASLVVAADGSFTFGNAAQASALVVSAAGAVTAACAALEAGIAPEAVGRGEILPTERAAPASASSRRSATRPTIKRAPGAVAPADLDDEGIELLKALREWRLTRSRAANTPAFVICNDRTLIEIAQRRPTSTAELLGVYGFGEVKAARFGPELLAIISGGTD